VSEHVDHCARVFSVAREFKDVSNMYIEFSQVPRFDRGIGYNINSFKHIIQM
jgi:hypothetical protein